MEHSRDRHITTIQAIPEGFLVHLGLLLVADGGGHYAGFLQPPQDEVYSKE